MVRINGGELKMMFTAVGCSLRQDLSRQEVEYQIYAFLTDLSTAKCPLSRSD